jgi:hypothetical protein
MRTPLLVGGAAAAQYMELEAQAAMLPFRRCRSETGSGRDPGRLQLVCCGRDRLGRVDARIQAKAADLAVTRFRRERVASEVEPRRHQQHALALLGESPGDQHTLLGPVGANRKKDRVQEQRRELDVVPRCARSRERDRPPWPSDTRARKPLPTRSATLWSTSPTTTGSSGFAAGTALQSPTSDPER